MAAASPADGATFAAQLLDTIAQGKSAKNFVFSPASIETCMALTYLGAEGNTAKELQNALQLSRASKQQVAEKYSRIFNKTKADSNATLLVANRIYVADKFQLSEQFDALAAKYFKSKAENVKFFESATAAKQINSWVEQQTANKINNLISADSLDNLTAAVLVNAIYFKGRWRNIFDSSSTTKKDFSVSKTRTVPVDMMFQKDDFLYGELEDLNATALELSYKSTDIAMLVLLPKSLDGLTVLEKQLKNVDLTKLSARLRKKRVRLHLPKFKIEFDISLQPALEQLGIKSMFTKDANFSGLLKDDKQQIRISEVKHKTFIEVNELGTEAAGATYAKAVLEALIISGTVYDFNANHPFFFALKDKANVYFAGHVADF